MTKITKIFGFKMFMAQLVYKSQDARSVALPVG